jgi:predicted O-methyltransferase YrrM
MKFFPSVEVGKLLHDLEDQGKAHDAAEPEHSKRMLNLEPETAELVSILARSSGAQRALEIGTSNGYSTIWLAASIGPAGGRVTSIDRSPEKQRMAHENLSRVGLADYVDLRRGDATEAVSTLPGPFDFVLFDADRKSAPEQLKILLPKLERKALVLADNALSHPAEIADYIKMVESLQNFQHIVVPIGKGLSVGFYSA